MSGSALAQSVSYYTTADHNSYVPVAVTTAAPPLTLLSAITGIPDHEGWFIPNGNAIEYSGSGTFGTFDLTLKSAKAIISDPGLRGVHAAVDSGYTTAWYLSATQRKVYLNAYDASGTPLWTKDLTTPGPTFLGIPTISQSMVYYGSGSDIVAAALATGQKIWSASLPALAFDSLTISSGVVVASSQQGLYGLTASTGGVLWSSPAPRPLEVFDFARLTAANGAVVCRTFMNGDVSILDLHSGNSIWSLPSTGGGFIDTRHPPVLGNSGILVPLVGGLKLLDYSGKVIWANQYPFLAQKLSGPGYLMLKNVLLAAGADGLYAISLKDGSVAWKSIKSAEVNGLQYAGGSVYASFRDNTLQIYSPVSQP